MPEIPDDRPTAMPDNNDPEASAVVELIENVAAAMFLLDRHWRFTYMNAEAERVFQYARNDILGKSLWELYPDIAGSIFERYYREAMEQGHQVHFEEFYHPNQNWYEIYLSPTRSGLAVYFRNINERKRWETSSRENEERLRILSEATSEGIVLHDKGVVLDANLQTAQMFGYSLEELIGSSVRIFIAPESLAEVERRMAQGFDGSYEAVGLRKDGTTFPLEGQGKFIIYQGRLVRAIVLRDLQERKAAEALLKSTQAQLLQSQRMESVGRLAGGIAHDFNNLLTAIIGYCELTLYSLDPSSEIAGNIEEINRAAERAATLTRQLLAFSRQQVLQPKIINLNSYIKEMANLLERLIGEDIELTCVLGAEADQTLVDPSQFEQVLMNLAVNARDAMPEGGKLTIETGNVELDSTYHSRFQPEIRSGAYVMLAVSDTGIGMDEATQARIFDPFFTTKEVGKGTGLGLSTVYGIVRQSDGFIYVYSEPGSGTTFKVYLPAYNTEYEGKRSLPVAEARTGGQPERALHNLGTETILVVEDDETVRNLITKVLREYGYNVHEAINGEDALDFINHSGQPLDLVLTDIIMPRLGGQELVDKLNQQVTPVKILCMSGYTDRVVEQHKIMRECRDFLQKPFTPEKLVKKVRETLDNE